jgi:hypothetical protein
MDGSGLAAPTPALHTLVLLSAWPVKSARNLSAPCPQTHGSAVSIKSQKVRINTVFLSETISKNTCELNAYRRGKAAEIANR